MNVVPSMLDLRPSERAFVVAIQELYFGRFEFVCKRRSLVAADQSQNHRTLSLTLCRSG
jgi:hypothetical protein